MSAEVEDNLDEAKKLLSQAYRERKAHGASMVTIALVTEAAVYALLDIANSLRKQT